MTYTTDQRTGPPRAASATWAWICAVFTLGYMLPWAVAAQRGARNSAQVAVVCLLTGWTVVGWVVALVMALKPHQVVPVAPLPWMAAGAAPPAAPGVVPPQAGWSTGPDGQPMFTAAGTKPRGPLGPLANDSGLNDRLRANPKAMKAIRVFVPVAFAVLAVAIFLPSDHDKTPVVVAPATDTTTATTHEALAAPAAPVVKAPAKPAAAKKHVAKASAFPVQDGDWQLDSFTGRDDGLGDFGGRGRVTYVGGDSDGGNNLFTVTVFDKAGGIVAVLHGSASDVMPGTTKTVEFISTDAYRAGSYSITFQNDL